MQVVLPRKQEGVSNRRTKTKIKITDLSRSDAKGIIVGVHDRQP